ncbi:ABC transporter permease [Zhengella mangrovi]|uniref:ABC transporter permease n=1 Tax=Zhengella mangrovi TaxID=1982044 RepID=A0A2G1QJC4_9HYPH|nr:ABC transporter permease [Zhengella mangrovi]PHP65647.1 ABC transporter permease [Zhengella mangrovi]
MHRFQLSQQMIVSVIFVLLFAGLSLLLPGFANTENLLTLLQNVAILGILGLGMAVIVIGRGVDLSMIASLAIPVALTLQLADAGHSTALAIIAGLALSALFGAANGWLIAYAEVPPLFVTLASGLFLAGLGQAFLFSTEAVVWPEPLQFLSAIGRGRLAGIPNSIWIFALVAVAVHAFLSRLTAGVFTYSMGDNPMAARLAGIPVRIMVIVQYVSSALIATLAGFVMAASVGSMSTRIYNSTWIYDVILVVVLGGIGLSGGRGSVTNVLIGTLLIGTLLNGLTILDVSFPVQNLIKGFVLLAAIMADTVLNPRNEETAQQGDI